MASALASTLTVPGGIGFFMNHSQLQSSSSFGGVPFLQPSYVVRAAAWRPLLVAAVGGPSSESLVEDPTPSTSSSAEVSQCCHIGEKENLEEFL